MASRNVLAKADCHAVVPTGQGGLNVCDLAFGVVDSVPTFEIMDNTSSECIPNGHPHAGLQAASHSYIDRRHCGGL